MDYIGQQPVLQPFYAFAPTWQGLQQAIEKKQQQPVDRAALVKVLENQYQGVATTERVRQNIQSLLSPQTFTICTAHQPNLFTGPLYFIYKILHVIRLAEELKKQQPQLHFVPVFYMGSEDADLQELNHTYVQGKRYEWKTEQTGAVGRMVIDKSLVALIDEMAGQLLVAPYGKEVVELLKQSYQPGKTIQTATFEIINELMGKWGLLVLIADTADLKKAMIPVFEEDLFQQRPSAIVEKTCQRFSEHYNVQANPRDINLFYLKDNLRERIIKVGDDFAVHNTTIRFTPEAIKAELHQHPERFSPNVILRGLYQETILPNIAFIGGGGEVAYWLQLKELFDHYHTPFPVLVLRNSFLIIDQKWQQKIKKLDLATEQLFETELDILNGVLEKAGKQPQLNGEVAQLAHLYEDLKEVATAVDVTLQQHVEALKVKALNQLISLEKKMQRAERKKHQAIQAQIAGLKEALFPRNGLQERVENFSSFYARWGSSFLDALYDASLSIEQQFVVLQEA